MNEKDFNNWDYALFSAHIHQFLPQIPWHDHPNIYRDWQAHHLPRPLISDEQFDLSELLQIDLSQPSLLCLYHLGLHGQLPIKLAQIGLYFDILLDSNVYAAQEAYFIEMKALLDKEGCVYRFLMSDDPSVLLQVRTTIKQGKHLLLFADGNSGTQTASSNKIEVVFLYDKLRVRQGIGLISYLLKIPIVPMSHREQKGGLKILLGDSIVPNQAESRNDYIKRSVQELYDFLAQELQLAPWRWECWSYLHRMDAFVKRESKPSVGVQEEALIKLILNNKWGNFDRKNYFFYY